MRRLNVTRILSRSHPAVRTGRKPHCFPQLAAGHPRGCDPPEAYWSHRAADHHLRERADRLRAAGPLAQAWSPPLRTTGCRQKTLTGQYLSANVRPTIILTTGLGLGFSGPWCSWRDGFAPSMVVLEDVDLIAEARGMPFGHSGPLLFELSMRWTGCKKTATSFPAHDEPGDILEPALAARPGRIDWPSSFPWRI